MAVHCPRCAHEVDEALSTLRGFYTHSLPRRTINSAGWGGFSKLNRLSVNTLLKAAISIMAVVVVIMLAGRAWDSWQRLATTGRISAVADASRFGFKAMHTLRTDRATTFRELSNDGTIQPPVVTYIKGVREAELPALQSAVDIAESVDFPGRQTLIPELRQEIKTLTALAAESWEAFN